MKRPDPMKANSVCAFLKSWMEYLRHSHQISLRQIAKDAKVSVAILPLVLSGKRRITEQLLNKLLPHLKLKVSEASFLRRLHRCDNEAGPNKSERFQELRRFGSYKEKRPDEYEALVYLSHWIYPTLRELMCTDHYVDDVEWIQSQLRQPLKRELIAQAREFLISHSYVVASEGRYKFPEGKHVVCDEQVQKAALIGFHRGLFQEAAQALVEVPRDQRNIQAITVGLSPANYKAAVEILDEALNNIRSLALRSGERTQIYALGINAFPMTLAPGSGDTSQANHEVDDGKS
jgi:uncharacterized protein (TIGR02147 family)